MSAPFKFKQFSINQDRCAMKVGTDGVLLGAWVSLQNNPDSILDVGAGTGIISLMLAQRSNATIIDAIEIDTNAYEQCVENFEASPWADRLFCYHAGWDEFMDEIEDSYDLILSNPPFYSEKIPSRNKARDMARQNEALPFDELFKGASKLLSKKGVFSLIVPFREEEKCMQLAAKHVLFPLRICRVKGNPTAEIKRSLLEFGYGNQGEVVPPSVTELTIEIERHHYTQTYMDLTKDFYLKM